jgi:hypothetical protein
MQCVTGRSFLIWSLGTKNDGLFYLQVEEIGALDAAFAIVDGNAVQDEFDSSVVAGHGLNSRELRKRFSADRFGKEIDKFAERLKLTAFKPRSRNNKVPRARSVGPPEKGEQREVAFLRSNFMHRLAENADGYHRISKSLSTHVTMSAACCGWSRPIT